MEVYVINLKDAVERKISITRQLEKLDIPYELFEAINGRSLSDDELAEKVDMGEVRKHPDWLTKGALGCALSHIAVYKKIVESNSEWNLILEDDVVVSDELKNILSHIEKNGQVYKNNLNLLYSLSKYGPIKLSSEIVHTIGLYNVHKVLNKTPGGAGAYIIHRRVAASFLSMKEKIKVAPDAWSYFLEKRVFSEINCFYPFVARPGFFESTIGYVNEHSFIYRIKHFVEKNKLQPFYAILKWNRRRVWKQTSNIVFK